jgi:hypothetical protein
MRAGLPETIIEARCQFSSILATTAEQISRSWCGAAPRQMPSNARSVVSSISPRVTPLSRPGTAGQRVKPSRRRTVVPVCVAAAACAAAISTSQPQVAGTRRSVISYAFLVAGGFFHRAATQKPIAVLYSRAASFDHLTRNLAQGCALVLHFPCPRILLARFFLICRCPVAD